MGGRVESLDRLRVGLGGPDRPIDLPGGAPPEGPGCHRLGGEGRTLHLSGPGAGTVPSWMVPPRVRAVSFVHGFNPPFPGAPLTCELVLPVGGDFGGGSSPWRGSTVVARHLFPPPGRPDSSCVGLPGGLVLHGITRPGSATSLSASAGPSPARAFACFLPEIPEWRELEPGAGPGPRAHPSGRTIPGAGTPALRPKRGRTGSWWASSLSAPPRSSSPPGTPDPPGSACPRWVGFGGYCHLRDTLRFQFTGEFQEGLQTHSLRRDPYGRWVVGANYLTEDPRAGGWRRMWATALHTLASAAGEAAGSNPGIPSTIQLKATLRKGIAARRRELFDLFAPWRNREPDREATLELVEGLFL